VSRKKVDADLNGVGQYCAAVLTFSGRGFIFISQKLLQFFRNFFNQNS
jgi:hypothetical protein